MQSDVSYWCRTCLVCATRNLEEAVKPLTPILVSWSGHSTIIVGVDILQLLLKSSHGNCYAVVFMDYLTKWLESVPCY